MTFNILIKVYLAFSNCSLMCVTWVASPSHPFWFTLSHTAVKDMSLFQRNVSKGDPKVKDQVIRARYTLSHDNSNFSARLPHILLVL